jgi:MFS family permease
VRRLVAFCSLVVLVDTMLYAALAPLLPRYADELGLSKTEAGLVVAGYAAGVLVGALPGGFLAARYGPRRAAIGGLALVAVASVVFGFADEAWSLGAARFAQGLGSALSWSGARAWLVAGTPRERRGELLGTALGAAIFGALLGPTVGAAADVLGPEVAFPAVGGLGVVLIVWALRMRPAPPEPVDPSALRVAFTERRFTGGLYFMLLPSLLFGTLAVLVPLRLGDLGWGAVAIGALFIGAASIETVLAPLLGRVSDRRGRLPLIRLALLGSCIVSAGLAVAGHAAVIGLLVIGASFTYGAFYAPAMALISQGADRSGLAQGLAFGLMNAGWAIGNALGPAAGGLLAEVVGDALPFLLGALLCLVTLLAARPRARYAAA